MELSHSIEQVRTLPGDIHTSTDGPKDLLAGKKGLGETLFWIDRHISSMRQRKERFSAKRTSRSSS